MKKFFIISFCLCLTGCVAMFKPEKRIVSFQSNPPGAIVLVDKVQVGITPVKVALPDGFSIAIVFEKDGYEPVNETIDTHKDLFWRIMQNIPFPILGMVFGSNFENMSILDKTEIYYDLKLTKSNSKVETKKDKKRFSL